MPPLAPHSFDELARGPDEPELADELVDGELVERADLDALADLFAHEPREVTPEAIPWIRSMGRHDQHRNRAGNRRVAGLEHELNEQIDRRAVGPMEVVDGQEDRPLP